LNAETRKPVLDQLQQALGHKFADPKLLEEALVHPSANPRRSRAKSAKTKAAETPPSVRDYNRLEFIGDRVLGLVVATLLAERFPQAEAGELALRYNALVKQESLARFAQSLGLGDFIQLSRSERDSGGGWQAGHPGGCLRSGGRRAVSRWWPEGGRAFRAPLHGAAAE
jgi:ribonuclease-3